MSDKIKELAEQAEMAANKGDHVDVKIMMEKFAELIVKECADFVRETYDHEAAESIAWNMEIKYGLHGDYA